MEWTGVLAILATLSIGLFTSCFFMLLVYSTDCRRLCGLDALTRLHLSADSRQQEKPQ